MSDIMSYSDESLAEIGASLPVVRRRNWRDLAILLGVLVLGVIAVAQIMNDQVPPAIGALAVLALIALALLSTYLRMTLRTDHVRATQSENMLEIANESLGFLRQGLDETTAGAVCRIVLKRTEAAAVAITDADTVLGFAGVGEEHHLVGGPIITRATRESLEHDAPRILHTKGDIGCPEPACQLRAAIVVPLRIRERPAGTLKFYYTSDRYLNETQLALAEGLARLLSTQLELSELERQTELAVQMELKALQAQINPHFLFNTINTIAAFIRTDPTEARRLLRQFGTFYRRTLEQAEDLVTLDRELEFVEMYLELEKARFGDRLKMVLDVEDQTRQLLLPAFMIQPLVENSVGHGMRSDGQPLTVRVSAHLRDDALCIEVADDGEGIPRERLPQVFNIAMGKGLGIALRNVRDRLRGHSGPESSLEIESEPGQGTVVRLTVRPVPPSFTGAAEAHTAH